MRFLPILCSLLLGCSGVHQGAKSGITKIAFGSCAREDKAQPIWDAVNRDQPDAFIFLGDNIYADTHNPKVMAAKYRQLEAKPGFQKLRSNTEVFAIWDDHDYGQNDAGLENPIKDEARRLFLEFWREPLGSPRWTQPDGIYAAYEIGEGDRRVQILLPDLRWQRTPLQTVSAAALNERERNQQGPYQPVSDDGAVLLGEAQWQWLQRQLQAPAAVRIVGSSLQLLPEFTGWESWANFPDQRSRFLQLLQQQEVEGLFIVSGDTHWAEISRVHGEVGYPLLEFTSSGLTETWKAISPNRHRISEAFAVANYGLITIDWHQSPVAIKVEIKDVKGKPLMSYRLNTEDLRTPQRRRAR